MNFELPILHSPRVSLFVFQIKDLVDIYPYITKTLTRYMSWEPAENFQALEQIGQQWILAESKNTDYHFVLRCKETHTFIGLIGVHRVHTTTPELGLWIREDHHGQGYAKEALFEVFRWASQKIQPEYFLYPVAIDNHASRKLAEFLGGVVTGKKNEKKYQAVIYHIPPHSSQLI